MDDVIDEPPADQPAEIDAPAASHAPIAALRSEREKRQAAERELAALKAEPPADTGRLETALQAQTLLVSRKFADRQYGAETMAQVHDWATARCDADPGFNQRMRISDDPYEAAMQAWRREQVLEAVQPDDLEAFKAWKAGQSATPPAPPRSLATAPGNGAAGRPHVPVGDGEAYGAIFPS